MKGYLANGEYIKHEDEKNKLRMGGGSWTINLDWINMIDTKTIVYVTDRAVYRITAADALKHGFSRILNGEKKLVVPEKHWTITAH